MRSTSRLLRHGQSVPGLTLSIAGLCAALALVVLTLVTPSSPLPGDGRDIAIFAAPLETPAVALAGHGAR